MILKNDPCCHFNFFSVNRFPRSLLRINKIEVIDKLPLASDTRQVWQEEIKQ